MPLTDKFERAKTLVDRWGQAHLLRFYDELEDEKKEGLLDAVLKIDFERLEGLYRQALADSAAGHLGELSPIQAVDKGVMDARERAEAERLGLDAIAAGRYAVVTMAGGQGTRLGYDGPKGTFAVALDRVKTLFEVQLEQIARLSRDAGAPVPWYIMTSRENHEATITFFEEHDRFGYPDIVFFQQGSLPMVSKEGKILLEEKDRIKEGPDGNGSIFRAMRETGVAQDMRRRGVQWFFVCNVDNILTQCADPLPIGLAMKRNVLSVSKSILKRSPDERVGVFCRKDGRPGVIEYTEIPAELASRTGADGRLEYGDSHISCTLLHTDVLGLEGALNMPYHVAVKKAACVDEAGNKVVPEQPNAFKFEAFIFDVFRSLEEIVVLRVNRNEEFAPIKNAEGEDSPQTARILYLNQLEKSK